MKLFKPEIQAFQAWNQAQNQVAQNQAFLVSNENVTQAATVMITAKFLFWKNNEVTAKITQNVTITVMRYM